MVKKLIRIATRCSPLALAQTDIVKEALLQLDPELNIELVKIKTTGDKFLQTRLDKIGGKGLFTKELEVAMLDGEADLAVHSMKDMPTVLPPGLMLASIIKRDAVNDVFISKTYQNIASLPDNATVATSSLRRQSQIKALKPQLNIVPLRGNINSRLQKMVQFDGIILAQAGINRLDFGHIGFQQTLHIDDMLPAAGQGAIGIECRDDDSDLIDMLNQLACQATTACVEAERALTKHLNGSCHIPLAAHATLTPNNHIELKALVASADGQQIIRASGDGAASESCAIGEQVARKLLSLGAKPLLEAAL